MDAAASSHSRGEAVRLRASLIITLLVSLLVEGKQSLTGSSYDFASIEK